MKDKKPKPKDLISRLIEERVKFAIIGRHTPEGRRQVLCFYVPEGEEKIAIPVQWFFGLQLDDSVAMGADATTKFAEGVLADLKDAGAIKEKWEVQ
ncbi:hypothetical protein DRZ78_01695 [Candidatus Aerophobetes bacterium]|uniref:Uncharacterized protein n=1 Tax=Aerophobetes bacterium TaxID=2030807 RepID=A0A662D251_UNCAE|nr:MAG: hypothetical protein DRZ78_01695 [Candidatus Aerophobetes bacterium]